MDHVSSLGQRLTDEQLWNLVQKCDVVTLKSLLSKVDVPRTAVKERLQKRLFYAIRLGLELVPTEDEQEKQRRMARKKKLLMGEKLVLPHPLTLEVWEDTPANFPPVTLERRNQYFDRRKLIKLFQRQKHVRGGDFQFSYFFSLFTAKYLVLLESGNFHVKVLPLPLPSIFPDPP